MQDTFVATEPWNPTRPHVLVVCCSDGRFHQPITEFVRVVVSDRSDLLAVPGGPIILDPWASSFDERRVFDTAFDLFLQYHDLNQCWLIAHEGCAYYRMKQPGLTDREYEEIQYKDLRRGAETVAQRAPHLAIHLRFARLRGGRVSFEEVSVEPAARTLSRS